MEKLIFSPHLFALWFFVKMPKTIALVIKRFLQIINNQLSFSVNIRLIFTPLFGDYTIIGRFIGFFVRIFEIIFGIVIMAAIGILYPIVPVFWILLPFLLLYKFGLVVIPFIGMLYVVWLIYQRNIPLKKVKDSAGSEYLEAFRPNTLKILKKFEVNQSDAVKLLLSNNKIKSILARLELTNTEFSEKLQKATIINKDKLGMAAFDFAKEAQAVYVAEASLFGALMKSIQNADIFLSYYNTKLSTVENGTKWFIKDRSYIYKSHMWDDDFEGLVLGGFGKGMTGRVTRFLDSMSEDYTKQAFIVGFERHAVRKKAIKSLADLLSGSNENILIIGQPGSGKTSLVKGMAYEIMKGTSHKSLWNKRIVSLDLSGIISGTNTTGELAEKLKWAIAEAKGSRDIILFIDEIHTLIAGSSSANPEVSTIFNLLEPELAHGGIQFIAATTIQSYRKYIEPNGAFARLFHLFELEEATFDETFKILEYSVYDLERKKGIFITYNSLEKCIELSKKLIHERVLPDKAIQLLDRASTYVMDKNLVVDSNVIAEVIAEVTHVPSTVINQDEANKILNIETEMKKVVIGQDHAIKQIGSALKRARAGIRNENKPIASFLFVGTTGVGKTQTAKALAQSYFGDKKAMIRLDMSEYQQLDSISRLLGTPDGSTRGILTDSVRSKPFALILLDEIEKAHSNILLTFLQVLDDGRLTDSSGITVDFTNSIIIATSNVGTRSIQSVFEQQGTFEQMTEAAMKDVRANFAPEFLNRFTGLIVFNPLSVENAKDILEIRLSEVAQSAEAKNIKVSFKDELKSELIKRGYNKEWGARPLTRVLEDTVETYIAEKILAKEFLPGTEVSLGLEAIRD